MKYEPVEFGVMNPKSERIKQIKTVVAMIFRLVNIRHDVSHWVLVLVFIVGSYFRR